LTQLAALRLRKPRGIAATQARERVCEVHVGAAESAGPLPQCRPEAPTALAAVTGHEVDIAAILRDVGALALVQINVSPAHVRLAMDMKTESDRMTSPSHACDVR
jgi:hypothetical protein